MTAPAEVAVHQQAVSKAEQKAVLDYWTPQRIAALTGPSADKPPKSGPDGAPWTNQNALPRTVGRLFFTDHGEDSSCTATVVDSANGSTVVTAGHCVNSGNLLGEDNQWSANVMFVPGYHDGEAPYGKFVGRLGVAAATWLKNDAQHSEKFDAYDQAFVVLNPDAQGGRLRSAVGAAQQIGFDQPGDRPVHQFGYPRAASDPAREGLAEYTGARLAYCTGQAEEYPGTPDWPEPKGQWGTACVMGGGSSGGPRIADVDPKSGLGTVVGDNATSGYLNSAGHACGHDDPACTRHLVGPQFTSAITKPLYERAQRTP
ncbi:trypsin-like serine peptidase [Streptomyces pinistramenti]|uniref:trypsin-like serine peptidase n=1 Tax=Streptomyces pinistramenti TaxID=2884812 RepID=UPI001D0891C7|nr:peptidase [Streptomyces pinistramenti]MCB5906866.1 peptidase [Streptomyces pinistramenti]